MIGEKWTRAEEKLFEEALVLYEEEEEDSNSNSNDDRWIKIASHVPGRSYKEIRDHYNDLLHDVSEIDSGRVQLPSYSDQSSELCWSGSHSTHTSHISFVSHPAKTKHTDAERKKGTPWTEEEHRLFLIGLEKYGKGDWRSISRNVVVTRTPTQVASHAQKYYLRQNSGKKERKRSSIHDITTVDDKTSTRPAVEQNWIPPPGGGNPIPPLQPFRNTRFGGTNQAGGGSFGYHNFSFPM